MGRNPATGEPIQIKASKRVAFRASKELKEAALIARSNPVALTQRSRSNHWGSPDGCCNFIHCCAAVL